MQNVCMHTLTHTRSGTQSPLHWYTNRVCHTCMETFNLALRWRLIGCTVFVRAIMCLVGICQRAQCWWFRWLSSGAPFYLTVRELSSPPSHCLSPLPFRSLLISHWHRPLFSLWRCVRIQLVWVMLCCLVLFSNGHSGQESSWTRTHAQTHVTRGKSSQRLTIHSPHYHTACLSEGTESGGGGYVLLFYPRALSRRHGIAFTVARFHFHQTRKCHGSQGLSLNLQ